MATPKIVWNTNTWLFPGPIDNPMPVPALALRHTESIARNRDSWEIATPVYEITFDVPLIPQAAIGSVTGWNGANGVADALAWLSQGGRTGAFHPIESSGTNQTIELIDYDFRQHNRRSFGGARYTVSLHLRSGTAFVY